MRFKTSLWIAGIAVVAAGAVLGYRFMPHQQMATAQAYVAPFANPVGVTIQRAGDKRGGLINANAEELVPITKMVYADAKGMTLYTYDKDVEPGKSACSGDCAKVWPAFMAPADAKSFGDWSLVARDNGAQQWSFKGKPLYTFAEDANIGETKGNGAAGGIWHSANLFRPADIASALPDGVAVHEVADADGLVFVDGRGMTLYAFDGDAKNDKTACAAAPCEDRWMPLQAAEIANPRGDFTIVSRTDGSSQWAYKGRPLYTFVGDLEEGDANGVGVDPHWQAAALERYFTPPGVAVNQTAGHGKVLAVGGMTLYRRAAYFYQSSGHAWHHGSPIIPSDGRAIGTTCDAACAQVFHPLKAPADARSTGYWEVVTRDDGTKQWAYRGSALYTFDGDKKPGDVNAYDHYDYLVNDGFQKVSTSPVEVSFASSLYWTYAYP